MGKVERKYKNTSSGPSPANKRQEMGSIQRNDILQIIAHVISSTESHGKTKTIVVHTSCEKLKGRGGGDKRKGEGITYDAHASQCLHEGDGRLEYPVRHPQRR
ncbi:hypothetical protein BCR33DRAFT_721308 [Rhizoclosmatium globosum]|uniref:Uncharacterized protein n=1 Tax=Rhizoclosmatium globosum TaxID=329046 RepID=A0A1Y2BSU9_9FUNG|nr:hypothetical protein BCR33DRAFT_721308 [Rhizoclosmatium globosum]|eukprot:ORY37829.1 hypothetical protein BCR33DRAFT_721308 [Rhizoclosmatium globosum]